MYTSCMHIMHNRKAENERVKAERERKREKAENERVKAEKERKPKSQHTQTRTHLRKFVFIGTNTCAHALFSL